jgi:class 3 adenylate cyclase
MPVEDSGAAYEIAHVLFVDIVGYSLQPIDKQTELLTLLQKIVRESAEFRRARDQNELISLPTGDGMGLVFLRDPLSSVKCALEIAGSLQLQRKLLVRMGIHTGPVQRHADIREDINVVGGGINIAQRVMDCGDAGHILLSRNVAEVLEQFSDWRDCLLDLGIEEVKHGVKIHLYNLVKPPVGNPTIPSKLMPGADELINAGALAGKSAKRERAPLRNRILPRAILLLVAFALACALGAVIDEWVDRGFASTGQSGVAEAALVFRRLYQQTLAAPRNPIPRYTTVVEIDSERDPGSAGMLEICRQRKMMGVLVQRIAAAKPKVIVIDKFFGESACPDDINPSLIAGVSAANVKAPVIVGRRLGAKGSYLLGSLFGDRKDIRDAIVTIDQDTRKLPLRWNVFPSKADMENKTGQARRDTLALAAAEVYENGNLAELHPELAKLLDSEQDPYISFLNLEQFEHNRYLAGFVLCGRVLKTGEDATECPAPAAELDALRGRIVLIGEITDQDIQTTVVGRIPGVFLQANYIEALLDDRYYYEGSAALNYIFAFLFLAAFEMILLIFQDSWPKKLGAITILMVATVLSLYIVISEFHLYVNPIPFIALALLIRALAMNLPYFRRRETAR